MTDRAFPCPKTRPTLYPSPTNVLPGTVLSWIDCGYLREGLGRGEGRNSFLLGTEYKLKKAALLPAEKRVRKEAAFQATGKNGWLNRVT